ncbi:MAG TPA: hypothetical protein VKB86_18160 [Pyrinomonadaceae bacterium]|nr:hypothetical protein [Pyrinomonadaceae bacterium]
MRLARRALFVAFTMLMLSALASAQTLRQDTDPRNLSPSVGTGGPEGGPTGLFTIYDGQTLRRGEYTFSIAYSNYDRDPGNVDITSVPLSFNVGLSDHLELWFKVEGYRGVKVNNPQNLSSFYLPNSQVYFGPGLLGSPPAIILAPGGNVGTLAGTAIFRPAFCAGCTTATSGPNFVYFRGGQPFVQYPFIGGTAPNFGLVGNAPLFGFPGFAPTLGPVIRTGSGGSFGPADAFPGIGSPVGSILPGIVLATATLPPTLISQATVVPVTFTTAPSYLPDDPFINRLYGQSTMNNLVFGAKWRLTGPNNPFGVALIPFYRWWLDKADDQQGFNMMQRGSGPGGSKGDFGLVLAVDGRLSRSVNLSANLGYILNSNPKFADGSVILDRPDELLAGVGFDFPVNKHFQPIFEVRSTQYVGGRTPNAFENSPVEALAGMKIYPGGRWWGIGLWYRRHIDQQRRAMFNGVDFNTQINQITNVTTRGTVFVVPGTTRPATVGSFPQGFTESDEANGFGFQFFAGHRNPRAPAFLPNQPPVVNLSASKGTITLPCPPGTTAAANCTVGDNPVVQLAANASDPDGDTLLYTYSTTGGRITGDGANVSWDLTGVTPGTYTATVEVDDGCGCVAFSSTTVTVASPPANCCAPPCPTVSISCPTDTVQAGTPATVSVNLTGGGNFNATYTWTVSAGTITSGQGTPSITIDTTNQSGNITATVDIGGLPPECDHSRSCTFTVAPPPINKVECTKFDEYNNLKFNDEKARLDNFAIQLQQSPGSQGYYVIFGSCDGEADQRSQRAVDYLVNTRGIDRSRITVVNGGCRETLTVELWLCPTGAAAPTPNNTATVTPCPKCKPTHRTGRRTTRRRGRRHGEE